MAPRSIFYSWQTDSSHRFNRYFIEDCLKRAIKQLNREDLSDWDRSRIWQRFRSLRRQRLRLVPNAALQSVSLSVLVRAMTIASTAAPSSGSQCGASVRFSLRPCSRDDDRFDGSAFVWFPMRRVSPFLSPSLFAR